MQKRIDACALVVLLLAIPVSGSAQWPANGLPLTTASTPATTHAVCADASGGIIVTWSEFRNGQYDILAGRATAAGVSTWTAGGVEVCGAALDQVSASICPDGTGGAIVTWRDHRSGGLDIYAQRLDAHGKTLWAKDGIAVCAVANNQYAPVIVSDGGGGAVIAWYDYRSLSYDIYAQRVDGGGNILWVTGGVAVYVGAHNQFNPVIVTDGAGGAIVAWTDLRNGNADIYARRVDAHGTAQWSLSGTAISLNVLDQLDPVVASDGTGGAIIAWRDLRGGASDIYAQRLNAEGTALWTADGVSVCSAAFNQIRPAIAPDGAGGAIVAWEDGRGTTIDIYAQRVDGTGVSRWTPDGVVVCGAASGQSRPAIVPDGAAGAVVAWEDLRAGNSDVYAQRVSPAGAPLWAANGVAVCAAPGSQLAPLAVADALGGTAMAWRDSRAGNADIYAYRVGDTGGAPTGVDRIPGTPAPVISSGYPNPFTTAVRFDIDAHGSEVRMEVFDVAGRLVAIRRAGPAGAPSFDGRDQSGRELPSGVYLVRFTANGATVSRKVVLTR